MRFTRVHHVSLNVSDLDAALEFYTGVLEMPVLPRPDFGFPGAWLDAGEQQIHLLESAGFEASDGQHFALQVDDVAAITAVLESRDVTVSPASTIDGVCVQAFFSDPTGNLIEINQPAR
ncbi:MAG: VOC family protein [Acidimicrobiia bacterium]|nr:VOC family protein [Acidimicrobiia bacterium]